MSHTRVDYREGEEKAPGMFFLRDALDCENLGLTVIDADPGWTGMEHDHEGGDHEEVYLLVEGAATLDVDGESVELVPDEAVRVAPEASRQLRVGDEASRLVVVGAP
ncbi:MAG: cupin domain-containing protein [Haloferacaceae archaeon]